MKNTKIQKKVEREFQQCSAWKLKLQENKRKEKN